MVPDRCFLVHCHVSGAIGFCGRFLCMDLVMYLGEGLVSLFLLFRRDARLQWIVYNLTDLYFFMVTQFYSAWVVVAIIWLWGAILIATFYPLLDGGI